MIQDSANTKLLSKIKYEFVKAYLVLCSVNQPLMRLAENERSGVRSASGSESQVSEA